MNWATRTALAVTFLAWAFLQLLALPNPMIGGEVFELLLIVFGIVWVPLQLIAGLQHSARPSRRS